MKMVVEQRGRWDHLHPTPGSADQWAQRVGGKVTRPPGGRGFACTCSADGWRGDQARIRTLPVGTGDTLGEGWRYQQQRPSTPSREAMTELRGTRYRAGVITRAAAATAGLRWHPPKGLEPYSAVERRRRRESMRVEL